MQLIIPDFAEEWPFPTVIHPDYENPTSESAAWIEQFISSEAARQKFREINVPLLVAYAYPRLNAAHLRTAADTMSILFLTDDITDTYTPQQVLEVKWMVSDAFQNPEKPRPPKEHFIGEMHRSFWSLARETASPIVASRFIQSYMAFLDALYQQALDREKGITRNRDEYIMVRRHTSAVIPSLDLLLLPLKFEIPEHLLDHPITITLENLSNDLIWLSNDVYSYNIEQARGDEEHNMVSVAMNERHISLQTAVDYVGQLYRTKQTQFLSLMKCLPPCDDPNIAESLSSFVVDMANWATANVEWSFRSERYFGTEGSKIKQTRLVELSPRAFTAASECHVG